MKVEIVDARFEHVVYLVENLRLHERLLYAKALGPDLERMVVKEISDSIVAWAGLGDGKCGALWGVKMAGILSDSGVMWMLGGRLIDEHPLIFLRHSKRALNDLRATFKSLQGCVLTEYSQSQRWLEWLGFKIGPDQGGISYCEYRFP